MVGLAKSYKVYSGDQVKIDAYAMFRNLSSNESQLSGFASALLSAFGLSAPVAGETGTAAAGLQTWGALAAGGYGDGSNDNTDPKAFVNIILFDKNYNFLDIAYAQLTGSEGSYTLLSANYTVKEEGYAYMYISNENSTAVDVYFDDITMTYTPTNVIQYNEYYPFGLQTADSWTRDNSSNNFLYNEGSELNQTSGFYDLPFRNYDASLGRFFQVDPLSYQDNATSPFAYAGNNPVVFTDPSGLMFSSTGLSDYQLRMLYRRDMASYLNYDDWASQNVIEYAAGKGFDAGGTGNMWGSWSSRPILGYIEGRKPRYESDGYNYQEIGIVGYEWYYTPGTGRSPFEQVKSGPAETSGGKPQGNWGGSGSPTGGPPIIFINFAVTPHGFNKQEYFDQLQQKLVENGFNPNVQVKQYSMSDRLSAWWNNSPTATISISNYHTGDPIDAGAFSHLNDPNSIIIYNGLNPLSIRAVVATWAYVNTTLHEIGHAFFGFTHDAEGNTTGDPTVMDYDYQYAQGMGFNLREKEQVANNSIWGNGSWGKP
ncbi:MAG TPA: RHS repeat-associated core domain-containing protein [Ohtaekwangia sp.]|uniref:RHS repeat-associated core domain-containing protein n=1 Tax=Ohtaekwangia sp. TaxID=2066019 RepID=UPI002F94CF14